MGSKEGRKYFDIAQFRTVLGQTGTMSCLFCVDLEFLVKWYLRFNCEFIDVPSSLSRLQTL